MKRSLIPYDRSNIEADRQNIYITETKSGKYNIPQQFTCPCTLEDGYYIATVTDNKLEGCNNFGLSITLPEIKGVGSVRYQTNFVYKLIEECVIETIDNEVRSNVIIKKSGLEFLLDFNQKERMYPSVIGNNSDFCSFKIGKFPDDVIFQSTEIYFPLIFIFDHTINPRTCLRLYPETKLRIKIKFKQFHEILLYNSKYKKSSLKNILDVDLQPYIKFTGYNTCGSSYKNRYIEELVTSVHQSNKKNYCTPEFLSISNILWYPKSDMFSGREFVAYPNFPETKERFVESFVNKLLPDLITISKEDNFLKSRGFNDKCKFKQIKAYDKIEFDANNNCVINIMNVPDDHYIYFHMNILSFSRRNNLNEYNISKKFKYILGTFIKEENKIIFHNIEHTINISDVSIPIDIWNAEENTACGDLRSSKSKKDNIFVNDPFVFGMDFLSNELGLISRTLTTGSNETIAEINNDKINCDAYFGSENLYSVTPITEYSNPSIFIYRFNSHNIVFTEPSRLSADIEKNFRYVNLSIDWKEFPEVDPRSLFTKKLIICMTIVKKILYDNNIITVQVLD